ncbi:hypothetical protein TNCV_1517311 [Trichonephila clavipes]|nr:hypothetical protein TNCV_1517311 [Trichonephila clavipes]
MKAMRGEKTAVKNSLIRQAQQNGVLTMLGNPIKRMMSVHSFNMMTPSKVESLLPFSKEDASGFIFYIVVSLSNLSNDITEAFERNIIKVDILKVIIMLSTKGTKNEVVKSLQTWDFM